MYWVTKLGRALSRPSQTVFEFTFFSSGSVPSILSVLLLSGWDEDGEGGGGGRWRRVEGWLRGGGRGREGGGAGRGGRGRRGSGKWKVYLCTSTRPPGIDQGMWEKGLSPTFFVQISDKTAYVTLMNTSNHVSLLTDTSAWALRSSGLIQL